MLKRLEKGVSIMNKVCMAGAVVLMLVVVAACALQVASRYIPGFKILGMEELARLAFIWMSYLGLCVATGENANPSMTAIEGLVPKAAKPYYNIVLQILCLIFAVYLAKYSFDKALLMKKQMTTMLRVNMTFMYCSVVLGAAGSCINCVNNILQLWAKRRDISSAPEREVEEGDSEE